jgi:hypothetical protein
MNLDKIPTKFDKSVEEFQTQTNINIKKLESLERMLLDMNKISKEYRIISNIVKSFKDDQFITDKQISYCSALYLRYMENSHAK